MIPLFRTHSGALRSVTAAISYIESLASPEAPRGCPFCRLGIPRYLLSSLPPESESVVRAEESFCTVNPETHFHTTKERYVQLRKCHARERDCPCRAPGCNGKHGEPLADDFLASGEIRQPEPGEIAVTSVVNPTHAYCDEHAPPHLGRSAVAGPSAADSEQPTRTHFEESDYDYLRPDAEVIASLRADLEVAQTNFDAAETQLDNWMAIAEERRCDLVAAVKARDFWKTDSETARARLEGSIVDLEAARKALEPFARIAKHLDIYLPEHRPADTDVVYMGFGCAIRFGDLRAAARVVQAAKPETPTPERDPTRGQPDSAENAE